MKQIFWVLMIVAVFIYGTVWYSHRAKTHAANSGKAPVHEQTAAPGAANATNAQTGAQTPGGAVKPPASDTILRNPPNGTIFAGSGKYQLYRQGDITWRLNTDTGDACVLFATDAQWRKQQVYNHGCGAV